MFASANFCASGLLLYKQHVQHDHCHLVHSVTAVLASRAFIHFVILAVGHFRIPYVPGPGFSCAQFADMFPSCVTYAVFAISCGI